ncbi:MAG: hypothetical protein R8K48_03470 [Gallionella sp.]
MSYDENDAAMDAFYDDIREQIHTEIISEFKTERLQSYFLSSPNIAKPAYLALEDALSLQKNGYSSAAFLFAVIAIEVAMKAVILKPIVHGLVHNLPTSSLISDIVVKNGFDRIKNLLFGTLKSIVNVDLHSLCRLGSNENLWSEIIKFQKKRDFIVHRAEMPSEAETALAIKVAKEVLDNLLPQVITALGLHIHKQGDICNMCFCKSEGKYSSEQIKGWKEIYNEKA